MRKVHCDYCQQPAEVSATARGPIWLCIPFDAWVPIYINSNTAAPMGRLANAELREAKRQFNHAMRPIIDMAGRRRAYEWLATAMGLSPHACDGHRFDLDQARKARQLCIDHLPPFAKEA
jgi:hypothetical protein